MSVSHRLAVVVLTVLATATTAQAKKVSVHAIVEGSSAKHAVVSFYCMDVTTGTVVFEAIDTDIDVSKLGSGKYQHTLKLNHNPSANAPSVFWFVRIDGRKNTSFLKLTEFKLSVSGSDYAANLKGHDLKGTTQIFGIYDDEDDDDETPFVP